MNLIKNKNDFHSLFAKTCNFPDYYGKNIDAWIDCVTVSVQEDKVILQILDFEAFNKRLLLLSNDLIKMCKFYK
jgi:RNAse (barnase) inhibitor barstar